MLPTSDRIECSRVFAYFCVLFKSGVWTLEETKQHGWPSWRHLQKIEAGKNITFLTLVNLANQFEIRLADLLKEL